MVTGKELDGGPNRGALLSDVTASNSVSRRRFLRIVGATGLVATGGGCMSGRLFVGGAKAHDPDLTVLLSDVHVNGQETGDAYQRDRFSAAVAEILKLDPMPARAIVFGDLAWLWGHRKDYECSAPQLKLLEGAGIHVTIGMGNHDRRSTFLEVHPGYATSTKVPGRIVSVVDAGAVDFIMLDGLQGTDDRGPKDMGPVPGALCEDQQDWILDALPKWKKPVSVCSHFPVNELKAGGKPLEKLILDSPNVAGYIHGHDHSWYTRNLIPGYNSSQLKRSLCLPSTGHWGDIGYALMRVRGGEAVVSLCERDYYFPTPKPPKDPCVARTWKAIARDHQGLFCTFVLPGATA